MANSLQTILDKYIKDIPRDKYDATKAKLKLPTATPAPCVLVAVLEELKRFQEVEEFIRNLCDFPDFDTIYELTRFMANRKKFHTAVQILEIVLQQTNKDKAQIFNSAIANHSSLVCLYADCLSKDPYGIIDKKHDMALTVLKTFHLTTSIDIEPLYTAGKICFRHWQVTDNKLRLVDGGVSDNQGLSGLLAEDCTVLLVSDGSGLWPTEPEPKHAWPGCICSSLIPSLGPGVV